ncbi:MAG: hypothetical protein KF763_08370 [Cyclobacteriaceae bacterium]|nr:hypothetical protein [Cyclobacteriaceae bacterium]
MSCTECQTLLMQFGQLTESEKNDLHTHTTSCAACAQALAFIELEQRLVKKIIATEPLHAAALTHKIMQSLPTEKVGLSFGFLNTVRVGFAAVNFALFIWLGSELLIEKTFHKPTSAGERLLNSSEYITHPRERKTKTISLTERIKNKGL